MSADNFGVIMPHPKGGYAVFHGSGSMDYEPEDYIIREDQKSWPTVMDVFAEHEDYYFEYGLSVHDSCENQPDHVQAQIAYHAAEITRLTKLLE